MGSFFRAEREEAAPIELCVLHERHELVVIVFGFTWVADNEVAAERGIGGHGANTFDALEETRPVSPSLHASQMLFARMLQRQVEIRHTSFENGVNQFIGQVAWIEIQQAHPISHRCNITHQLHDGSGTQFIGAILAIACEVLRDENHFTHFELFDFGENRGNVATALWTTETWDGAEAATTVAAFGDFHIGPWRCGFRTRKVQQVELWNVAGDSDGLATQLQRHTKTGNLIGFGKRFGEFAAVALGHATRDDETRGSLAGVIECEHRVDAFFAGIFDECTRVHNNDIGLGSVIGGDKTIGHERACNFVGIDLVLRTTQSFDVVALNHRPEPTGS